ncbi:hypothetical protein Vqi01_45800 [Micromonospora qiuiae]|uniref:Uncharacterized protein n=1 Tax=Micromonospora qiuiae TaxID=502268 RepID=A0ABQ4JG49_9ACTN|nr:hypothetical protein Vqi01_45800 [Micromonospora qiuiae]
MIRQPRSRSAYAPTTRNASSAAAPSSAPHTRATVPRPPPGPPRRTTPGTHPRSRRPNTPLPKLSTPPFYPTPTLSLLLTR